MKYTEIMKNVDANSKRGVNMPGQRARIIRIIKSTRVDSQKQITNCNKELTPIAHDDDDDDDAGRLTDSVRNDINGLTSPSTPNHTHFPITNALFNSCFLHKITISCFIKINKISYRTRCQRWG
jgi:hypothetical protein